MQYRVCNCIDMNGMCAEKSEVNETVTILNGRKGENLIFQRLSDGIQKVYGVVINLFFKDVLVIKTESLTLILEPV